MVNTKLIAQFRRIQIFRPVVGNTSPFGTWII